MQYGWDLYIDEQKSDGGNITCIGALCLYTGIQAVFHDNLVKAKNDVLIARKCPPKRAKAEIHWTSLDVIEAEIVKKWLDHFFRDPLMFFVRFIAAQEPQNSMELLVKKLIEFLEQSPSIPNGFNRSQTTVHIDYDTTYNGKMLSRLWHDFGLLRVFKWDSHGSELLQLSDVLLGISAAEIKGLQIDTASSNKEQIKAEVLTCARSQARRAAANGKKNGVIVFNCGEKRWLFIDE